MIGIAWTTQQRFTWIDITWEFSAGHWTGWSMQNMQYCVFLSKVILGKNSGNGIWITILDVLILILILHCQSWTTGLVFSGMEWVQRDQSLCCRTHLFHAVVANAFFCLNGITTGIAHPPSKKAKVTVEYACGTRVMTNKCTSERVNLGMLSGSYCRMCYHKHVNTNKKEKKCRTSSLGCPICKEPICKECWKEGYDKHT